MIEVPASVLQSGLVAEYTRITNYTFEGSPVSAAIKKKWENQTKHKYLDNRDAGIALLDNHYLLIALSPDKFCSEGYKVKVNLENGKSFDAVTLDEKGVDRQSPWGHQQKDGISIVEWEGEDFNIIMKNLRENGWYQQKIKSIEIAGKYNI